MHRVSTSPLRYFQFHANGRRGARDYAALGRTDPFRSGQVCYQPRLATGLNTVERMIAKPCPVQAELRNFY